ncbi:amino acid ABC transporter permease [Bosea sp. RAF48]|jgi:polar amino acid transport system permease protein|uniref:amino acid ABC transporter permease n=1 Tax=Bosea sp. RAF48 TaxID=3237480 RepID=UPI003F8DB723
MDLELLRTYGPNFVTGLKLTLLCWILSSIGASVLGLLVALLRQIPSRLLQVVLRGYVEIFRGTPLLVQIFLIYAGGPSIGLVLEPVAAGVLALSLHGSAYIAEIFRGALAGVPRGHVEAAASLGMHPAWIMVRIVLPQALVSATPPLVNMILIICKETAVLSIITVAELTFQIQKMAVETFAAFEAILALALCYWAIIAILSTLGRFLERRVTRHLGAARV